MWKTLSTLHLFSNYLSLCQITFEAKTSVMALGPAVRTEFPKTLSLGSHNHVQKGRSLIHGKRPRNQTVCKYSWVTCAGSCNVSQVRPCWFAWETEKDGMDLWPLKAQAPQQPVVKPSRAEQAARKHGWNQPPKEGDWGDGSTTFITPERQKSQPWVLCVLLAVLTNRAAAALSGRVLGVAGGKTAGVKRL